MATFDSFNSLATLSTSGGSVKYHKLSALSQHADLSKLPFSIKILLEACLRNCDDFQVTQQDVINVAKWQPQPAADAGEVPFKPARVILQDFTGVPCVVDLAAMRSAMKRAGGDPQKINPLVPVDLVIDHSVQVDEYGTDLALLSNSRLEFERNRERYEFLKWGQKAFENFGVVPPAVGIVHQVNLEHLAKVVMTKDGVAFPDTLVGTDSHTTMINGLGVLGWGVGGIEAEAAMLGQPLYLVMPKVVGFKLTGVLPEGTTATDLVLTITQVLRKHGVVDKFVEFYGPGLAGMSLADRATIANMAPEYGATMGFFPVDHQTLKYLVNTGRPAELIDLVERYSKAQGLWCDASSEPVFSETLELDLSIIEPSMAGPRRPQDRVALSNAKSDFDRVLTSEFKKSNDGHTTPHSRFDSDLVVQASSLPSSAETVATLDMTGKLQHGDVVIAAITSCTNTSNPSVMIAAGLVARKANALGLTVPPFVKTSLAPGSRVVTDYLEAAGLQAELDAIGFNTVGYGCTTCIGNSGPLPEHISKEVEAADLVAVSVLSGNRNFEGRINPHVKANYLASPPLVVAYALAGSMNVDLQKEPIAKGSNGQDVFLKDIWPTQAEVNAVLETNLTAAMFSNQYEGVGDKNAQWNEIPVKGGELFNWDPASTYVQEPPFFIDLAAEPEQIKGITGARVLAMVGDSVTTDHISPAGAIKTDSPAGKFLSTNGVPVSLFNSYGSRRGNDRVMVRGTFANIRLKNQLAPGTEGGWTKFLGDASKLPADLVKPKSKNGDPFPPEFVSIFDASRAYGVANTSDPEIEPSPTGTPLVVLAGKDYGMGSSRDWAAKGTVLLGVKAVIAESFERIHRSNLVGMGVLPLVYADGATRNSLGLDGSETFSIPLDASLKPRQTVHVTATKPDGTAVTFNTTCRIDTPVEVEYYRNGGILQTVLRKLMKEA